MQISGGHDLFDKQPEDMKKAFEMAM